jgi:hypothetical protein
MEYSMARPSGALNKSKQRLINVLREEYGDDFDPVMKMAKNCSKLQQLVDSKENECGQVTQDAIALILSVNREWDRVARCVFRPNLNTYSGPK